MMHLAPQDDGVYELKVLLKSHLRGPGRMLHALAPSLGNEEAQRE
jgi:hypothetical protein